MQSKHQVKRIETEGHRFYYYMDKGYPVIMSGITTLLSKVMPESKFLTDWKLKWGKDYPAVLDATAEYGSAMHACIEHIMKTDSYPTEQMLEAAVTAALKLKKYVPDTSVSMIKKNLVSFIKFKQDYSIQPVAIECILAVPTANGPYALTLDLLCFLTMEQTVIVKKAKQVKVKTKEEIEDGVYTRGPKKGQPKFKSVTKVTIKEELEDAKEKKRTKVLALVDFKSNPFNKERKSFFDSHQFQLMAAAKAVKYNFGHDVEVIANWSPGSSAGKYTLNIWKPELNDWNALQCYETIAHLTGNLVPRGNITKISEWKGGPAEDCVKVYSYPDYVLHIEEQEKASTEIEKQVKLFEE